jgi:iron complex transport system permease protein
VIGALSPRAQAALVAGVALVLGAAVTGLSFGAAPLSLLELSFDDPMLRLRLPRVALGLVVGAGLGAAGGASQALLRNALAEPGVLGVSAGAATGAALVIVVLSGRLTVAGGADLALLTSAGAFGGAVACSAFVVAVAGRTASTLAAVLAGLALSALASAILGFLTVVANDAQLRALAFWTLGSLGGATPDVALVAAALLLPALAVVFRHARALNALLLGDAIASSLGVRVAHVRRALVWSTSLLVAAAIAPCGVIAFVGLVAPHAARALAGTDHRATLPLAALLGAALVVLADAAARAVLAPAEIPLGILTSLLGAPLFFWRVAGELRRRA